MQTNPEAQRAFLVALDTGSGPEGWTAQESLDELAQLAATAGAVVVGRAIQRRPAPDPATYIGEGKAREIEAQRQELGFDLVIFDGELSPVHQRNLERIIGCGILDRTALILDIFATRARTREAKLQVELAQLQYRLTRLAGKGVDLSRLGGGIGTRGPGETKLEVDRRRIRERIGHLRRELAEVAAHRQRLRRERREHAVPVVALTGYTNAGKSTLHRALAGSDVLAEDRLFATLDATARRVEPPGGGEPYVLVDTVGFIQKLPHTLVAAFRSTLEEVTTADLILHVVDTSHPKREDQMRTVASVLADLGAAGLPQILVFNKVDVVLPGEVQRLLALFPNAVAVSALTGIGLDRLQAAIQVALASRRRTLDLVVPYSRGDLLDLLYRRGRVLAVTHGPDGTHVQVELEHGLAARVQAELAQGVIE